MSPEQALKSFTTQPEKQQFHRKKPQSTQSAHNTLLPSPMNDMSPLLSHTNIPGGDIVSSPQPHRYPSPMSSQTFAKGGTGPNTTLLISNQRVPSSAPQKSIYTKKRRRESPVASIPIKEDHDDVLYRPPKLPKQISPTRIGRKRATKTDSE
jgi:hypothetical protein